jgi:hypothetical protein
MMKTRTNNINGHGAAYDRGSADRYYGRGYCPHYYVAGTSTSPRVEAKDMTPEELDAYRRGWDEETDRKEWD